MGCLATGGRPLIKFTGNEGIEFCPEIQSNYTLINSNRTEISRCGEKGSYFELFGTGESSSYWREDLNVEVSGKVTYYKYEIPTEGYANAVFSDTFEVIGEGSGWLNGFVSGEGTISGVVTGDAIGYAGLPTGEDLRGTANIISDATGLLQKTFYATGDTSYIFDVEASGEASKAGWTGLAFGRATGTIQVEVVDPPAETSTPRGSFRFNNQVSGDAYDYYRIVSKNSINDTFNTSFSRFTVNDNGSILGPYSNFATRGYVYNDFIVVALLRKGLEFRDKSTGTKFPISNEILPDYKINGFVIDSSRLYVVYTDSVDDLMKIKVYDITSFLSNHQSSVGSDLTSSLNLDFVDFGKDKSIIYNHISSKQVNHAFHDITVYNNILYCVSQNGIYLHDLTTNSEDTSWSENSIFISRTQGFQKAKFHNGYLYFLTSKHGIQGDSYSSTFTNAIGRCALKGTAVVADFFTPVDQYEHGSNYNKTALEFTDARYSWIHDFIVDGNDVYVCGTFMGIQNMDGVDGAPTQSTLTNSLAKIDYSTQTITSWKSSLPYKFEWNETIQQPSFDFTSVFSIGLINSVLMTYSHRQDKTFYSSKIDEIEYNVYEKASCIKIDTIDETLPLSPGVISSSSNETFFVGSNYGEFEIRHEDNSVTTNFGHVENLWKFGSVVVETDITPTDLFTGNLDTYLTATGDFSDFTTGSFTGEATDLSGILYVSGLLTGHLPVLFDGSENDKYCINTTVTGDPIGLSPSVYYAHHQIKETGAYNISPINEMKGFLNGCFVGSGDYTVDEVGFYDFAWASYEATGDIPSKNLTAIGISLFSEISGDGIKINHGGDPHRIFWTGVETDCPNDEIKKALDEIKKLRDNNEEEEEEDKCVECSEEDGLREDELGGGAGDGAGGANNGASNSEKEMFYTTYSGRIEFNSPVLGDKITFKTYNFDYDGKYRSAYPNNPIPPYEELKFELEYGVDYNDITGLRNAINNELFNKNNPLWLFYLTGYYKCPDYESGVFRQEPFLKAKIISRNEIEIVSRQPGQLGNYQIKSIPSGVEDTMMFALPSRLKVQGSHDKETWNTLFNEGYEDIEGIDWEKAKAVKVEVKGSESFDPLQERFIEIHNNWSNKDAYYVSDYNSAVYKNVEDDEIANYSVMSVKWELEDSTALVFNSTNLPNTPLNLNSFDKREISVVIKSGTEETTYVIQLPEGNLKNDQELDENGDIQLNISAECPTEMEEYTRVFHKQVASGKNVDGETVFVTIEERINCIRCKDHIFFDGGELLGQGYVSCEQKEKKENDEGAREFSFEGGEIKYILGENQFDPQVIFTGTLINGRYLFNKESENSSSHSNIGIYSHNGMELEFGNHLIRSRDFGINREKEEKPNEEGIFLNQFLTGFQFCNTGEYDHYRVLFEDFKNRGLENSTYKNDLYVHNIALFGDYSFENFVLGEGEMDVIGAEYSGDILLLKTGTIEGEDSGEANEFGVYHKAGLRTGLPNETFTHPDFPNDSSKNLVPYEPFSAFLDQVVSGIDFLQGEVQGHFYEPSTKKIYTTHPVEAWVTGKGPLTGIAYVIDPEVLHLINESGYMELNTTGVFTGTIKNYEANASGVPAFTYFEGQLVGTIGEGSGHYRFVEEFEEEATGQLTAYYDNPTGYINATAEVTYGTLSIGDSLTVDGETFYFHDGIDFNPPEYFESASELVDVINDGNYNFSGELNNGTINLFAKISGEEGNTITLSSEGSIEVGSSTFTGGVTYYPEITPTGTFKGSLDKTVDNVGTYEVDGSGYITGTINIYSGTREFTGLWSLLTGEYAPELDFLEEGLVLDDSYNSTEYTNLGALPSHFKAFLRYNNDGLEPDEGEGADYAVLQITGLNGMSGIRILISGA